MPAFGPQAIFVGCSQLIHRWERFADKEIDVCANFTRLPLDTIALCSFNSRFNSFYQKNMDRFVDVMINALVESGRRTHRLSVQNTLMIGTARRFNGDVAYLHQLCDEIVKERREHPISNGLVSHCRTRDHFRPSLRRDLLSAENPPVHAKSPRRS